MANIPPSATDPSSTVITATSLEPVAEVDLAPSLSPSGHQIPMQFMEPVASNARNKRRACNSLFLIGLGMIITLIVVIIFFAHGKVSLSTDSGGSSSKTLSQSFGQADPGWTADTKGASDQYQAKPKIPYETVNMSPSRNIQIVISPNNLNIEDMRALGRQLYQQYFGFNGATYVQVYTDKAAALEHDQAFSLKGTQGDFYDTHYIADFEQNFNQLGFTYFLGGTKSLHYFIQY